MDEDIRKQAKEASEQYEKYGVNTEIEIVDLLHKKKLEPPVAYTIILDLLLAMEKMDPKLKVLRWNRGI